MLPSNHQCSTPEQQPRRQQRRFNGSRHSTCDKNHAGGQNPNRGRRRNPNSGERRFATCQSVIAQSTSQL